MSEGEVVSAPHVSAGSGPRPRATKLYNEPDAAIRLENGEDFAVYFVNISHLSGIFLYFTDYLRQMDEFVYRTTVGAAVNCVHP